jgi:hypothetical protein
MARRTNYGFEKKQRELRKLKKNQEKAERKRLEKEDAARPDGEEGTEETPPASEPPEGG